MGYSLVGQPGDVTNTTNEYSNHPVAQLLSFNTNQTGDFPLTLLQPFTSLLASSVYFTNASASLLLSLMAGTVRTAPSGGGTSIGSIPLLTGLVTNLLKAVISNGNLVNCSALYLNVTNGSGINATIDIYVDALVVA